MSKIFVVSFLFVTLFFTSTEAIKCYSCSVSATDMDQRCVTKPDTVEGQKIVNCNKEYCTIRRMDYKDPPNKVNSMYRGCEDNPEYMNTIIEDENNIIYYTACRADLCNGGNGKGDGGGGNLENDIGPSGVLVVKGSFATKILPEYTLFALFISIIYTYVAHNRH